MRPLEDEFYCYDGNGQRVNGRYDANGWFVVNPEERDNNGRNDVDGYILNYNGQRHYNQQMQERLTKRRQYRQKEGNLPKPDEFYCYDANGSKIKGTYNENGEFIVDPAFRGSTQVDADGFMVASGGKRVVSQKIKQRMKKREL